MIFYNREVERDDCLTKEETLLLIEDYTGSLESCEEEQDIEGEGNA